MCGIGGHSGVGGREGSLAVGRGHLQLCQLWVIKIQKGHTSYKTNGRTVTLTL